MPPFRVHSPVIQLPGNMLCDGNCSLHSHINSAKTEIETQVLYLENTARFEKARTPSFLFYIENGILCVFFSMGYNSVKMHVELRF